MEPKFYKEECPIPNRYYEYDPAKLPLNNDKLPPTGIILTFIDPDAGTFKVYDGSEESKCFQVVKKSSPVLGRSTWQTEKIKFYLVGNTVPYLVLKYGDNNPLKGCVSWDNLFIKSGLPPTCYQVLRYIVMLLEPKESGMLDRAMRMEMLERDDRMFPDNPLFPGYKLIVPNNVTLKVTVRSDDDTNELLYRFMLAKMAYERQKK